MSNAFFYEIHGENQKELGDFLAFAAIPHTFDQTNDLSGKRTLLIFPDLPVRQYAIVHAMFGKPGQLYPAPSV